MRVTNQLLLRTYLDRLENIQDKLFKNWEKITTGKELLYPSDNPIKITRVLQLRTYLSGITSDNKISEHLNSFFTAIESSLSNLVEVGQKVEELVVNARSIASEDVKKSIIAELNLLLDNIIEIGNTSWENIYIYAGTMTTTKPFEKQHVSIDPNVTLDSAGYQIPPTSGTITINGTIINIDVNVDTTNDVLTRIEASIPGMSASYDPLTDRITLTYAGNIVVGSETDTSNWLKAVKLYSGTNQVISEEEIGTDTVIFNANSETRQVNISGIDFDLNFVGSNELNLTQRGVFIDENKSINIFQSIIDVRDKIMAGDLDEITITSLNKAVENIIQFYTLIGTKTKRLEVIHITNTDFEGLVSKQISDIEDLDVVKGMIDYESINYYYQVNLMVSARLFQNNLLNYLK